MKDILSEIIANKRFEVDLQKQAISIEQLQEGINEVPASRSMKRALRNANGMHCGLCFPNILLFSMICVVGMNTPTVLWGKVIIPSLGLSRIHVSGNRIIFAII